MSIPQPEDTGEPEDSKICRICRGEQSPDSPLFYPCACTGSIRYIHQDCLQTWLEHSGKKFCELCGTEFKFIPMYSDAMPAALSIEDLYKGVYHQAITTVNAWSRVCLVFMCWGIIFPISARWSWRFLFEVWKFPWEQGDPMHRMGLDCLQGVMVGLLVCGVALGLLALRDFIVANGIPIADPLGFPDEDLPEEVPLEGPADAVDDAAMDVEDLAALTRASIEDAMVVRQGDAIDPDAVPDAWLDHLHAGDPDGMYAESPDVDTDSDDDTDLDARDTDVPGADHLQWIDYNWDAAEDMRDGAGDVDGHNPHAVDGHVPHHGDVAHNQNPHHHAHHQHHHHAPNPNLMGDRHHHDAHHHAHHDAVDADGDDLMDDDDVPPLEEMVGLVGPLNQLFNNLCLMIVITAVAVFVIAYVPHALGSAVLRVAATMRAGGLLAPLVGTFFDVTEVDYLSATVSTFWLVAVDRVKAMVPGTILAPNNASDDDGGSGGDFAARWENYSAQADGGGAADMADDAPSFLLCILTGYAIVTALAFLYGASMYLAWTDTRRGSSPARVLSFFCVFVKISALLASEVVLCPLLYGWWLDICSLDLQNSSLRSHREFLAVAPWSSSFLHWFAGMLFMHNFAAFIQTLREVLHPRVLWFFRDPNDPENHAVRQMLEMPLHVYARRLVLITILYGVVVVILVWLPSRTLCKVAPSILPYRMLVSHPLEMLVFNFGLPLLQSRLKPHEVFKDAIRVWFTTISTILGIHAYMLPSPDTAASTAVRGVGGAANEAEGVVGDDEERGNDDNGNDVAHGHVHQPRVLLHHHNDAVGVAEPGDDDGAGAPHIRGPRMPVARSWPEDGHGESPARSPAVLYPPHFRTRVLLLVGNAWVWAHVGVSLFLVVPVMLGRAVLASVVSHHLQVHDFYACVVGCSVLCAAGMLTRRTVRQRLVAVVRSWAGAGSCVPVVWGACKAMLVAGVCFGIVPLLVGVVLDLAVLVPLRCPVDMTPATYLWQDWGIGAMACQLLYEAQYPNGGVFVLWRRSLGHVLEGEFHRIDLGDVGLYSVAVLGALGWMLLVVYGFAFAPMPQMLLGAEGAMKVSRLVFPGCLLAMAAMIVHRGVAMVCAEVYNAVRDEKYLVGKRLMNVDATTDHATDAIAPVPPAPIAVDA